MSNTKVILKNDGIFVYEDYSLAKVARRLVDLSSDQVHKIKRKSNDQVAQAYMVSEAWYQAKVEAYALASTALPNAFYEEVTDDFLGANFSKIVDWANGRAQVSSVQSEVNARGPSASGYKGFIIINQKQFTVDDRNAVTEDDKKIGGTILARLLDPAHYEELFVGP